MKKGDWRRTMPKEDDVTKRKARVGNKVSHSKRRTKTKNELNLLSKRFKIGNKKVKLRITAKTLKTISKKGLEAVLKKYKIKV